MSADPARRRTDAAPATAEEAALRAEVEALRSEIRRLEALADRDVLTPLYNRRAFLRELNRAIAFCQRYEAPACLLYLDLDGFKGVNDAAGHAAGDEALKRVADLILANIRESDAAARLGGDEFGVLLLQAGVDEGQAKAAALGALIGEIDVGAGVLGGAFGVRAWEGHEDAEQWLAEADAAMFVRKRAR
ncbi:MAG: GGDEF domain-containing protein [Caulobacteraceae bacterium]|nr:GGDEF domain-containing protein [Caulobacteraceae bacterium]